MGVKIYQLQKLPVMNLETGEKMSSCFLHLSLENNTLGLIKNWCLSLQGDSGAPLLCRKRGAYFLFGVVTWGSRRCDADKPTIFSRISDYHSWITEVTEDV